ncbi:6809_t:CDS:2 [Funneliformis geosporum]|uniref:6809_t:CDS:1 n=1 Tax=Funneliformis geosporum TaxID=1117311 RepID=A0A9W4SB99_9GLOM|nr:6809_t:CDS:2 [Funneliformis geosporum]
MDNLLLTALILRLTANMLKTKLELLVKEFSTLKAKITTKLHTQQQTISESNRKLELATKENSENEKLLEQLAQEFKALAEQLN